MGRDKTEDKKILGMVFASGGAALLGSACLVGPVLFAALGTAGMFGSAAAAAGALISWAPLFWLASFAGLAAAWVFYRRGADCLPEWVLRTLKVATAAVLILGLSWAAAQASEGADGRTVSIQVEGLKSRACGKIVRTALAETPGVQDVALKKKFFSQTGTVVVRFDPSVTDPLELVRVIEESGTELTPYTGTLVSEKPES
ncbi:MAG TPA: heavy-metal-associated domain-containing protein [Nitrospiria bacterium]